MNLIERFRSALVSKPKQKAEAESKYRLQIGDKAIILSGTWAGRMFYVTHLSEDGRWVFGNFSYKQKVSVNNCELVRD